MTIGKLEIIFFGLKERALEVKITASSDKCLFLQNPQNPPKSWLRHSWFKSYK
jgi:hypothetical protein